MSRFRAVGLVRTPCSNFSIQNGVRPLSLATIGLDFRALRRKLMSDLRRPGAELGSDMDPSLVARYLESKSPATRVLPQATKAMGRDDSVDMRQNANEVLSRYLMRVIELNRWSQTEAGRHLGVSQKTISNRKNGVYDPKLSTCETMARNLGYELWQILAGAAGDPNVGVLIQHYLDSSPEGKVMILRTAEREAKLK